MQERAGACRRRSTRRRSWRARGAADLLHRPVVLRGIWLPQHTVFLDNRQMHGKPGFYVVTPLKLEGSTAAGAGAARLGRSATSSQRDTAAADRRRRRARSRCAAAWPRRPASYTSSPEPSRGPIRQNLDLAAFRAETGLALLDLSVQQTGAAVGRPAARLARRPPAAPRKHYGYAFQWWALRALIAILYVWFQFIAPRRKGPACLTSRWA